MFKTFPVHQKGSKSFETDSIEDFYSDFEDVYSENTSHYDILDNLYLLNNTMLEFTKTLRIPSAQQISVTESVDFYSLTKILILI